MKKSSLIASACLAASVALSGCVDPVSPTEQPKTDFTLPAYLDEPTDPYVGTKFDADRNNNDATNDVPRPDWIEIDGKNYKAMEEVHVVGSTDNQNYVFWVFGIKARTRLPSPKHHKHQRIRPHNPRHGPIKTK